MIRVIFFLFSFTIFELQAEVKVRTNKLCKEQPFNVEKKLLLAAKKLDTRLSEMIAEARTFQVTRSCCQEKQVLKYIKKLKQIQNAVNSRKGVRIRCRKDIGPKAKDFIITGRAVLYTGYIGFKRIQILKDEIITQSVDNIASLMIHELSHLYGVRDKQYFFNRGIGNSLEIKKWYQNADHYEFFYFNKFDLLTCH